MPCMESLSFILTAKKQDVAYEKYTVPDMDDSDEIHRVMYHQAQRTITNNHV